MIYSDLREWLESVDKRGELLHISGANWDLEMGGIAELVHGEAKDPKPAILFDNITGYPKGYRALFGLFGSTYRLAKALGLPENETSRMDLFKNWHSKSRALKLIPPKLVKSGPVLANRVTGDQIDLLKLPVPRLHEMDGGRYIGTCHGVIQRDPDTGYVNVGTYRIMMVDHNRLVLHILEGQHGSIIMNQKYFSRGKTMPVAIAIGMDPALFFASCHRSVPWGVSEYEFAGGVKGGEIEVIEGPHTGLLLPANAEIVIEGECQPGDLADEGPFGEWHGYYGNLGLSSVPEPVIQVKAIYYRDDPILTCQVPTMPFLDSSSLLNAIADSEAVWKRLETVGIPGIKGVWVHAEAAGGGFFIVVSIEQLYTGHSRDVGLTVSQYPAMGRYTIVVEDDIDPSNLDQVIWAMSTRSLPDRAIQILPYCHTSSADPAIPPEEKRKYKVAPKPLHAPRVIIDACRPLEWKPDWYPISRMSPELRTNILNKWKGVLPIKI
jgi:4-hydroxy-3-polyprenylbenzoate decarboxylase